MWILTNNLYTINQLNILIFKKLLTFMNNEKSQTHNILIFNQLHFLIFEELLTFINGKKSQTILVDYKVFKDVIFIFLFHILLNHYISLHYKIKLKSHKMEEGIKKSKKNKKVIEQMKAVTWKRIRTCGSCWKKRNYRKRKNEERWKVKREKV